MTLLFYGLYSRVTWSQLIHWWIEFPTSITLCLLIGKGLLLTSGWFRNIYDAFDWLRYVKTFDWIRNMYSAFDWLRYVQTFDWIRNMYNAFHWLRATRTLGYNFIFRSHKSSLVLIMVQLLFISTLLTSSWLLWA